MPVQVRMVDDTVTGYATETDYHRIFAEKMESLYLLAFLLTADSDKAEQCFDEECQDLLRCSRLEIVMAREVTFRLIAASGPSLEHTLNGHRTWPALLH